MDSLLEPDNSWPSSVITDRDAVLLSISKGNLSDFRGGQTSSPASSQRMLNSARFPCIISELNPLPLAAWTDRYADTTPLTALAECFDGRVRDAIASKWHPLHTSEYVWTKTVFQSFLLRYIGDNVDLVHHIESRPPFLDHHLTQYVNGIPPSLKMKYNSEDKSFREKHILREAMKPFITDEIYDRTKQPYLGPTRFAEDGPLHQVVGRLLTRENVDALGFLNWDQVSSSLNAAFREKDPLALRSSLLVAQFVVLSQRFQVPKAQCPP